MRALAYQGAGQKSWDEVPGPTLQSAFDAIVGVDAVTICSTDLHLLGGDGPAVAPGRVLGHEATGTVEAVGRAEVLPTSHEVGVLAGYVRPGDTVVVVGCPGQPDPAALVSDLTGGHGADVVTHSFDLPDIMQAYDVCSSWSGALKVVMHKCGSTR